MSIGGSKSSQKSTSTSNSSTQGEGFDYGTGMWSGQAPYLSDLYNRAAVQSWGGDQGQGYLDRATWLDSRGHDQLLSAQGMAQNAAAHAAGTNSYLANAQNLTNESANNLRSFLNPGETDPLSRAYATQMGQQFQEQFMPGLRGDAMLAGGLGGSRQQIGAALGAQRSQQAIGDFNASLYGQQQDRALAASQGLGTLGQMYQGMGQLNNQTGDLYNNISGMFGNIGQGWQQSSAQNMGMADFARSMPWYNLNQYSGLLGVPVTLDQGGYNWNNSQTTSSSKGSGGSGGFSFGIK